MRHYKLTIADATHQTLITQHFSCRRMVTAFEHGKKMLAEHNGHMATLEYAALGPCHRKYLVNGVWRNSLPLPNKE